MQGPTAATRRAGATRGALSAVIGVDDDEFGKRLRAFVVFRDGMDASEDDLKSHVKANLARFKVPREVHFVDGLPVTKVGKVDYRALASRQSTRREGISP